MLRLSAVEEGRGSGQTFGCREAEGAKKRPFPEHDLRFNLQQELLHSSIKIYFL